MLSETKPQVLLPSEIFPGPWCISRASQRTGVKPSPGLNTVTPCPPTIRALPWPPTIGYTYILGMCSIYTSLNPGLLLKWTFATAVHAPQILEYLCV